MSEAILLLDGSNACMFWYVKVKGHPERIITACHLTFAGPRGQMSDLNLVWSDVLANEIIRTRLNVWQKKINFWIGVTFCQITSEKL